MSRAEILAALREIRARQAEQDGRFAQLVAVAQNLGPVIEAWQQEQAEIATKLAGIEHELTVRGGTSWIDLLTIRLGWKSAPPEGTTI